MILTARQPVPDYSMHNALAIKFIFRFLYRFLRAFLHLIQSSHHHHHHYQVTLITRSFLTLSPLALSPFLSLSPSTLTIHHSLLVLQITSNVHTKLLYGKYLLVGHHWRIHVPLIIRPSFFSRTPNVLFVLLVLLHLT